MLLSVIQSWNIMASARVAKLKRQGSSRKDLSTSAATKSSNNSTSIPDGEEEDSKTSSGYKLEDLDILSTIGKILLLLIFSCKTDELVVKL